MLKDFKPVFHNISVAHEPCICNRCGGLFEAEKVCLAGLTLIERTCENCLQQYEAELKAEQLRKRKEAKELEFQKLCPKAMQFFERQKLFVSETIISHVLSWRFNPKGMLLHGPTGQGKTRVLWQLLRRLMLEDERSIAFYRSNEFSRAIECSYGHLSGHDQLIRKLLAVDVFALDDLGKFKWTERVEADLFDIIDGRTANEKPILLSTQYVGDTLAKRFCDPETAAATIRRLREFCECVDFS